MSNLFCESVLFALLTILFYTSVDLQNKLEDLVFNKDLDSDFHNGMHAGHRDVLKSFFSITRIFSRR